MEYYFHYLCVRVGIFSKRSIIPDLVTLSLHDRNVTNFRISKMHSAKICKERHVKWNYTKSTLKCCDYTKFELDSQIRKKINSYPSELRIKAASLACLVRVESRVPRSS
jgi:hypothetical protein